MQSLTIPITGMTCGGCVNSVRNALTRTPGVGGAEVKIGEATVTYDAAVVTPDALRSAITKAGFTVAAA